jgi:hypothetical protein
MGVDSVGVGCIVGVAADASRCASDERERNMPTSFRWEHNAMMAACTLTADDGSAAFVFCGLPGGTPQFQMDPSSTIATTVVNAPQCETFADFKRFVTERFGDDQ